MTKTLITKYLAAVSKVISIVFLPVMVSQIAFAQKHTADSVKITILSTMLAQQGIGEWGFSALVEVGTNKILFDAGGRENTVLQNAKELGIDLSAVPTLVLSHWHDDHTTGWLPLRKAVMQRNTNALSFTHVAQGFFDCRISNDSKDSISRRKDSAAYVQTGASIIVHNAFEEIAPGVYLTGNVPRVYTEKNYYTGMQLLRPDNTKTEDNIPDDMSLVIATSKGFILLSGCGHSGIINTIAHINKQFPGKPIIAAIGGFHLLRCTDEQIQWTATKLKEAGTRYFMGAHCTGIEPVYQIRQILSLKRGDCIVGSVGDQFDLQKGFIAGDLNR